MKELLTGTKASAQTKVNESNTAKTVGSGSLEVFATPMMTALMEKAACTALAPYLEENETTVGTMLNITHDSATPLGMNVTAFAEVTAVNGREICFDVYAEDDKGRIGGGKHKRFLVFADRFMEKTNSKSGL